MIDHIEDQLRQLTHERSLLQGGTLKRGQSLRTVDVPAVPTLAGGDGSGSLGGVSGIGGEGESEEAKMLSIADKEAGFALEMQIQIKRAEREKKRQVNAKLIFLGCSFVCSFDWSIGWLIGRLVG